VVAVLVVIAQGRGSLLPQERPIQLL
jgi:hypothetical protein